MNPKEQLAQLKSDARKTKTPNFPDAYRPKPKKSEHESVQLGNDIEKFCNLHHQLCEQVQTKGTARKTNKGIIFTAGNYTKGSSDCHADLVSNTGELISWRIEIKIGKDVQSVEQLNYQNAIENFNARLHAFGKGRVVYTLVKSFDDFFEQYHKLIRS